MQEDDGGPTGALVQDPETVDVDRVMSVRRGGFRPVPLHPFLTSGLRAGKPAAPGSVATAPTTGLKGDPGHLRGPS